MNATILGAIVGDTIGSVHEFVNNKNYDFELLTPESIYTDDSVMTCAVADWILNDPELSRKRLIEFMHRWGERYPDPMGGYGTHFMIWLACESAEPYGSWGNGSAMRVSPVGFAFDTLEKTLQVAELTASVTHNDPEGIKGAQATAAAIFMARNGSSREQIREYIAQQFGYDMKRTAEQIRKSYSFDTSCQGTVPEAIIAFLDSEDYIDAVRIGVSLGGDADTIGAITGAVAAAYYKGVPVALAQEVANRLTPDILALVEAWDEKYGS